MVKLDAFSSAAKLKVFRQKKFNFFLPIECLNSQLETIVATHLHLFPQKPFFLLDFQLNQKVHLSHTPIAQFCDALFPESGIVPRTKLYCQSVTCKGKNNHMFLQRGRINNIG